MRAATSAGEPSLLAANRAVPASISLEHRSGRPRLRHHQDGFRREFGVRQLASSRAPLLGPSLSSPRASHHRDGVVLLRGPTSTRWPFVAPWSPLPSTGASPPEHQKAIAEDRPDPLQSVAESG